MSHLSPLVLAALVGCSGGASTKGAVATGQAIPDALVQKTWQVRMADAARRAPFEAHPGWGAMFNRDHPTALAAFAADRGDGAALARVHLEYAAFYREAARLAANAVTQVYGPDRQPEDPVEVDYLIGVSKALLGDPAGARAAFAALPAGTSVAPQAAAWQRWLDKGAPWPPDADLQGFPGQPGAPTPGVAPDLGALPQYRFQEQGEGGRELGTCDPTSLYLLSRWHEATARQISPNDDAVITQLLAQARLPVEPSPSSDLLPMSDSWLFLNFVTTSEDSAFLAAAYQGVASVGSWSDRSPLAAAVAPAIENGQVNPDKMLDQADWLGQQVLAALKAASGKDEPFHRAFADLARVSALRAAMRVADGNGQTHDAGVLRINAKDRSVESAADPLFFISIAAWDTGNKNALRAQDLLHGLLSRFPAAEASRYPLDALHLRLSRTAAPDKAVF